MACIQIVSFNEVVYSMSMSKSISASITFFIKA